MTTTDDYLRTRAFEKTVVDRIAEQSVDLPWGKAIFTPSVPAVRAFNYVRVEGATEGLSAEYLAAETHRLQKAAELNHRRICIDDPELGRELAEGFAKDGWKIDRFITMVHTGVRPPLTGDFEIRPLTPSEYRLVHEKIMLELSPSLRPAVLKQLLDMDQMFAAVVDTSYLGAMHGTEPVAVCQLYSEGTITQIEDVATLKDWRGRGLARALMATAIATAIDGGSEFVFLVADADDWPKDFYERLGFEAVGTYYEFVVPGDTGFED